MAWLPFLVLISSVRLRPRRASPSSLPSPPLPPQPLLPPTMPTSFPRLDLPSPTSLSHVLSTLLSHSSTSLLLQQLEKDGLTGEQEELVCKRVLELWVKKAEERLKGNLSVEGVGWREWEEKSQGT